MALKLTYFSISAEAHACASCKDNDVKADFLAAFQLADPALFGLVDPAVEAMTPEDFEIVYDPLIQQKGFSQKSIEKFPPCVYITRLPSCETPKKKLVSLRKTICRVLAICYPPLNPDSHPYPNS